MEDKQPSEAMAFIAGVWAHVRRRRGLSWMRVNASMRDELSLAIQANMRFGKDDFGYMQKRMRMGYWIGANHERFFAQAVEDNHRTACTAYERWQERKPMIFRDGKRLYVGKQFYWEPEQLRLKVTSFRDDGQSLVACAYKIGGDIDSANPPEILARRITITFEDLKADRQAAEAEEIVNEFCRSTPWPTDAERQRIMAGIPRCRADVRSEHWRLMAERVTEIRREREEQ